MLAEWAEQGAIPRQRLTRPWRGCATSPILVRRCGTPISSSKRCRSASISSASSGRNWTRRRRRRQSSRRTAPRSVSACSKTRPPAPHRWRTSISSTRCRSGRWSKSAPARRQAPRRWTPWRRSRGRSGYCPCVCRRRAPGSSFNRVWRAIKKETLKVADSDVASFEDVDRAFMTFFGIKQGPFALMDAIGLDVVKDIEEVYDRERRPERPATTDPHGARRPWRSRRQDGTRLLHLSEPRLGRTGLPGADGRQQSVVGCLPGR